MSTSFSRPRITGFILGVTAVLCVSAQTAVPTTDGAVTTFTVSISEGPETFKYAEVVARLTTCVNGFSLGSDALKADCMRHLVSPDTTCSTVDSKFMCYVGSGTSRVLIDTANIEFAFVDPTVSPATPTGGQLDNCVVATATAGFTSDSNCYHSAACQAKAASDAGTTVTSYGDFCPSATGEYCCSPTAARDTGYFPGTLLSAGADYLRAMDHISDMSFTIKYEVEAPARLRIVVDVPFVTASSKLEFTEDNVTKEYTMCPSTYMIDFVPPVETEPTGFVASTDPGGRSGWLPLQHSAKQDLIGTPRSSCGNYDMTYGDETDFVSKFLYPTSDPLASLAYGPTPGPNTAVWDISAGTDGIPNGADHFWKMGAPNTVTGRVNYTSGAGADGFFDLVKTHYQCQNSKTSTKVVTKITEPDPTYINGVPFPVETYEWTMSVCQVGFFGANCANTLESQLYGKTCAQIPASFSIGPQQIAHVAVSPVSADLASKTFLESVRGITSNCDVGSERFAIALTLVVLDNDYSVMTDSVHDVHEPSGMFAVLSPVDIEMATADFDTVDAFLASNPAAEGVYKLKKTTVVFSGKTMHYHKIVMITQCYDTGIDSATGTRGSPGVFADAHATGENVHVDLEILLQKTAASVVTTNTLNLRILATKETFVLQSAFELTQKDVVAKQMLYGDYDQAKTDTLQNQFLPPATTMTGGDQICSKHQVQGVDAQVTNLVPNAVGACMLTASAKALTYEAPVAGDPTSTAVLPLAGHTISYTTPGMATAAKYTYGCFADWIDISNPGQSDYVKDSEGVYNFVGQLTRIPASETHESIFWFVQKQQLETTALAGTNEPMHDRFGTGLFYYNPVGNAFVTSKSDQMQTLLGTDQFVPTKHDQAGCDKSAGNMKSACNLVCFDLAEGLLTDPDGLVEKQVLVHHVSVATVATEAESVPGNKFSAAKHRRTLLESVATRTSPTGPSAQPSAASVEVRPGPMSAADTTAAAKRDTDGPIKHFDLALFIPVFVALPMIFLLIGCVAAHTRSNRLRKSTKGVSEPFLKNAF
jgi:hypothetical protein